MFICLFIPYKWILPTNISKAQQACMARRVNLRRAQLLSLLNYPNTNVKHLFIIIQINLNAF